MIVDKKNHQNPISIYFQSSSEPAKKRSKPSAKKGKGGLYVVKIIKFECRKIDWLIYCVFSNISAISWRPVLVVEEAGVSGENLLPWASNWTGKLYYLRLRAECTLFCNIQSQVRTHAVLVIGLYELLGNPTT